MRVPLHRVLLFAWVLLMLAVVAPALAQDGGLSTDATPQNLNEVATKLTPLLVGAALIERLLEFLFNLAESYLLKAGRFLRRLMQWINGTALVDARDVYKEYDRLRKALVDRKILGDRLTATNARSAAPEEWPLEKLEQELATYEKKVRELDKWLHTTVKSKAYVSHRKNVAATIGIVLGVLLAATSDVRLFQPLNVHISGIGKDVFDVLDMLMAGVLMGLGTDYVHQVINVVAKGQRYLGAATGQPPLQTTTLDWNAIREQMDAQLRASTAEFDRRLAEFEQSLSRRGIDLSRSDDEPPST